MSLLSFFDISLDTANKFYSWGWKASLLGAVVTLIGVSLLMWGTRVRDHDFESNVSQLNTDAAKSNVRAAQLENEAAKTKEAIAQTNERTAQAEARAAEANKKAEEERIERLKLEAKVSWRRLSPEQHGQLLKALLNRSFSMYFEYSQSDPEAVQFAEDIFKSLKNAPGITVYPPHALTMPPAPIGVTVSGTSGANRSALETALTSAGIKFGVAENTTGEPRLSVGSRPSPF